MKLLSKLDGHKTHIASLLAILLIVLKSFNVITVDQFQALVTLAVAFGFYGLRDAIRKLQ